jgi:hypothetical protein
MMNRLIETGLVVLLLSGAALNLAAGVRRPLRERAILGGDHYTHADAAAAVVTRTLPPGAPLAVVVYDGDMLGELDAAVWFDYRSRWLLYPRHVEVSRVAPQNPLQSRLVPGSSVPPVPRPAYLDSEFVLFFRVTAPPVVPGLPLEELDRGTMWVLTRRRDAEWDRSDR